MENKQLDYGQIRREYLSAPLGLNELLSDPVRQFEVWFKHALHAGVIEPNAMSLATVDSDDMPSVRIVLFKGLHEDRPTFYTNYTSIKASEIAQNPLAAMVFFWAELARQVRLRGHLSKLDREESDRYFQSRPRYSKIAAWASAQSQVLKNREELRANFDKYLEKFGEHGEIPTPPHWGGYCLDVQEWEFWQGRENRMHDRFRYRKNESGVYVIERLNP